VSLVTYSYGTVVGLIAQKHEWFGLATWLRPVSNIFMLVDTRRWPRQHRHRVQTFKGWCHRKEQRRNLDHGRKYTL